MITTSRLYLEKLSEQDSAFIFELLNTEGWKKFIGNRNITSMDDAIAYISKISNNSNITYWTARLNESKTPIGIVTLIQRDYHEHKDIGFAFLPQYSRQGYAYEATRAVIEHLVSNNAITYILAETIPLNVASIKLIEKLGLKFLKKINVENKELNLYGAAL